jgi:hypothetical protein
LDPQSERIRSLYAGADSTPLLNSTSYLVRRVTRIDISVGVSIGIAEEAAILSQSRAPIVIMARSAGGLT